MENDQLMITLFHSQGGFSFTASERTALCCPPQSEAMAATFTHERRCRGLKCAAVHSRGVGFEDYTDFFTNRKLGLGRRGA